MYLKKIELFGFKSFADKTEVVFERGVTCVVGPNGCGKSNISDSIRWVLGERSAKLLRGSKMEDVIFSGTDFRKPLNLAEVSLTIDNTDHKLPIQYEEVVITRRLHRSGESEYLLNKTPCRLKDIQDLILDTGIGSNAYSMIEQGRIDYILNAEPEEKRFLIEEAAGISKYKVKKEEALRKLQRTEENLLRLNDITSEVERNIRYAERQAQRAERYKEQLERLKTLEIQSAFFEMSKLDQELNILCLQRQEQETALKIVEESAATQNLSVHRLEEALQQLEESFFEQESARSDAKQALASLENQENFHRQKIQFLRSNAEKALSEIEALSERLEILNLDLGRKTEEQVTLQNTIGHLQTEKKNLEHDLEVSVNTNETETINIAASQELLFDLARQVTKLKNALYQNHVELITLEQKQASLKESQVKLLETKSSLNIRQSEAKGDFSTYAKKLDEERLRLNRLLNEQETAERSLKQAREELASLYALKTKLQSQFTLFEELNDVHGPDPKKIVAEHSSALPDSGVISTLLDLIEIQPGYELATEAALSDALKGVVAENVDSAVTLFNRLKESGSHHAMIFIKDLAVLNGALSKNPEADRHPLIRKRLWDAIKVREGYDAILGNLIGKFYVIDELTTESVSQLSKLAGQIKLVSKSGAIFGPEYQLTLRNGGYTPERSTLARAKEIEKLNVEIREIAEREKNFHKTVETNESFLEQLKVQEKQVNSRLIEAQAFLERSQGSASSVDGYLRQIEEELNLMSQELKQSEAEAEKAKVLGEELTQRLENVQTEETKAQTYAERIKNRKENADRDLSQLVSKLQMLLEKQETLMSSVEFLKTQKNDASERTLVLAEERKRAEQEADQLEIELEAFNEKKERLNQNLIEQLAEVDKTRADRSNLILRRNQALDDTQTIIQNLEKIKQQIHEFSLKQMQLNHQKNSITQDLQTRYKILFSNLNPEMYQLNENQLTEVRDEIERLREKLDVIGTVNLLAIDEYQELKTRYDFMLSQKKDLIDARDSLLEAIRKINRTTKKLFEETLVRVRTSFREYFRTLFGGGQADLILLDEENPFESGLDIVARPPGKKLQHITLLSGGEKALTAIALLLSLFSVKPSPFCVLDEVDAPLDEANNDRFINALKPFLNTTQFIIVTHSRKTIAMGDALYGVTMQEAGVSKLVSVRLSTTTDTIDHSDPAIANEINQILN